MIDIIQIAGSLGVGCFLAIIIFLMYRHECKNHRDRMEDMMEKMRLDRKFMEDRLTRLLEDDQKFREENTKTLAELHQYLLMRNGKSK